VTRMSFNNCKECGVALKGKTKKRSKATTCYSCLGIKTKTYELSNLCKSILKEPPKEPAEDELVFEDDPKAVNELEYGRVIKQSVGYVFSESSLADVIIDTKDNK